MKKRLSFLLMIGLIYSCFGYGAPASADSTGVCFISIGDRLTEYYPAFYGGESYVPASLLSELGVYNTYNAETTAVTLKSGSSSLTMVIGAGTASSDDGSDYSAGAIWYGGQIYVSAASVASFFGLEYSYISGSGNGDIVRIKNASAWLTDTAFLDAASIHMAPRANAKISEANASRSTPPQPSTQVSATNPPRNPVEPSVPVSPSPTAEPIIDRSATTVYISFFGIPSDELLDLLSTYNISAAFFLTSGDVKQSPSMVRHILGLGHRVGALTSADPEIDYIGALDLIFQAAREKTILVSSELKYSELCAQMAQDQGLVYSGHDIYAEPESISSLISEIDAADDNVRVRFDCGSDTDGFISAVLNHLTVNKFTVRAISLFDSTS